MTNRPGRICPVERAGSLDSKFRRWLQNPRKILGPYVEEGMTVLDIGCGPGFFSIEMAQMVGPAGRVIACDLQGGMLQKVRDKTQGTDSKTGSSSANAEPTKSTSRKRLILFWRFTWFMKCPTRVRFSARSHPS